MRNPWDNLSGFLNQVVLNWFYHFWTIISGVLRYFFTRIKTLLSFMGKKWVFEVYSLIFNSKGNEFSKIKKSLKITSTTLSIILKKLELFNLIIKNIISTNPVTVRYSISEKGKILFSCISEIVAIQSWRINILKIWR